jgi:hypothetical protein
MEYKFKAHPTKYAGVLFRSRLEARWAAFFDLVKWKWEYEPIDLPRWVPDFKVEFECWASRCDRSESELGSHTLLVEVKPYSNIEQFNGHSAVGYPMDGLSAEAVGLLGIDPSVSYWRTKCGIKAPYDRTKPNDPPGFCELSVPELIDIWGDESDKVSYSERRWREAGNLTQWAGR